MEQIVVYTDGSAIGKPPNSTMGWAWAECDSDFQVIRSAQGGSIFGLSSIGELCAVLEALRAHPGKAPLLIMSDSAYVYNSFSKWIAHWKENGWLKSNKRPIQHLEIIQAISREIDMRSGPVEFQWVKAHSGHQGNNLVDKLAKAYARNIRENDAPNMLPTEGWQALVASKYGNRVITTLSKASSWKISAGSAATGSAAVESQQSADQVQQTQQKKPAKKRKNRPEPRTISGIFTFTPVLGKRTARYPIQGQITVNGYTFTIRGQIAGDGIYMFKHIYGRKLKGQRAEDAQKLDAELIEALSLYSEITE